MGGKISNILIVHEDVEAASRLRALFGQDSEERFEFREAGFEEAGLPDEAPGSHPEAQSVDCAVLIQGSPRNSPSTWLSKWLGRSKMPPYPIMVVSLVEGDEREQERSALLAGALEFVGPSGLQARTLRQALERAATRFEAMTTGPAQLAAVFASMADGVAIFDMSGNLVLLNDAQARLNGYPSAEAMKRDLAYFSRTYELYTEQGTVPVEDWPISKVLRGETVIDQEFRAKRRDTGQELFVSLSGAPVRDRSGKPVLGVVISRDITAKKRDQDAIRRSEDRYRTLFESIDEGFCVLEMIFDADGRPVDYRFLETNGNFERQTGLVDPLGKTARELVPALDESWFQLYGQVALTGQSIRFENPAPAMGRWFNVFASRVGGPESRQVALVFNDVTPRKQAEEALRASEARAAREAAERSAILEQLAEGVIVTDPAGHIRFVNEAAKRIHGQAPLGVPPEQYSQAYRLFTEDGRPYPPGELPLARAVLHGESASEFRWRIHRSDGSQVIAVGSARPVRGPDGENQGAVLTLRDETARVVAEEAIRESAHRFQIVARATNDVVWDWNLLTDEVWWNESVQTLFGYPPEQVGKTSRWWLEHIHPQDRDRIADDIHRIIATGGSYWQEEYRYQCADGTYRMIFDRGFLMHDEEGKPVRMIGAMMDITHRKQAELEVHKFALLVEASNDFIGMADFEGNSTFVNAGGSRLLGLEPGGHRGRKLKDFFMPEDLPATEKMLATVKSEGSWQGEVRLLNFRNGRPVHVWCNVFLLRSPETGEPFAMATVSRDLTQVREKEEQLRQAQKMEAIGRLAGGVAHDFNNLLTAINGYCDMLLEGVATDDPKYEFLLEIRKAGQRAASLTSQLLAYSRKQVLQPEMLQLNRVVEENAAMLRRLIGEDIELALDLEKDLLITKADPNQIHQILLNLCLNSRDAMAGGGRISIRTRNATLEADTLDPQLGLRPGPFVVVTVTDTGSGMPPDVQERIFEPFFTTKEVGKGTGLGLSSVYGIVQQSGGGISVESEPGEGTTFKIYLPGLQPEQKRSEESPLADQAREAQRQGSILLVEDEDSVRKFVRSLLEREGYAVLEAWDGVKAMEMLQTPDVRPDLLVSDVIMPRMGGLQLAHAVRQTRPEIPILLMSGYTAESLAQQGDFDKAYQFIQKPFSSRALAAKIGEILHPETPVGRA